MDTSEGHVKADTPKLLRRVRHPYIEQVRPVRQLQLSTAPLVLAEDGRPSVHHNRLALKVRMVCVRGYAGLAATNQERVPARQQRVAELDNEGRRLLALKELVLVRSYGAEVGAEP